MTAPLLRERVPGQSARVTFVELFFDLVFVFAITQISQSLLNDLSSRGALQAGFLLLAVWWAWIQTAWITNWLDPDRSRVRAMLFVLMGLGLVLSTSLSHAFDGRALAFALAYVAIHVGRTLFMLGACRRDDALGRNFKRTLCWLLASGLLWIAGAFTDASTRFFVWGLALAMEYASPAVGFWIPGLGRTATLDWNVEGRHIAERCGMFILIALGETILVTGATFQGLVWNADVVAAFASAFVGILALWWIYFSSHADEASCAIADSDDPGRLARTAYTYAHLPLIAGVILTASGDELVLAHPGGVLTPAMGALLLGGPALFLAGALWFRHSVFGVIAVPRATGLVLLLAAAVAAPWLTPLSLSAVTSAILVLVGGWETWIGRKRRADATYHPPRDVHAAAAHALGVESARLRSDPLRGRPSPQSSR
jgi:low temperature requirement protein LtrA